MPAGSWRRLLLAVLLAAGLIVVLQVSVQGGSAPETPALEPPLIAARLPESLRRRALLVYLVGDSRGVPDAVAPVVEVQGDGRLEVHRPAALPDGPEEGPFLAVGIILPCGSLPALTPVQRAALLSALEGFSGGDRLDAGTVFGLGFAFDRAELRQLLSWVR